MKDRKIKLPKPEPPRELDMLSNLNNGTCILIMFDDFCSMVI